jgi:2-polyprenyl-6-methoxyphenol hydroxylase-like FAD-dependent oxidoreductase
MAERNRVPVFIVGGGPVGLALAVALDRFGIRSLVVERSATPTNHPKSRGCWVRLGVPLALKLWPASHEAALEIGCGVGRRGAVLVRPDGHVAWRMAWCPPDPKAELASAMTSLLAGTVADHPAMAWR